MLHTSSNANVNHGETKLKKKTTFLEVICFHHNRQNHGVYSIRRSRYGRLFDPFRSPMTEKQLKTRVVPSGGVYRHRFNSDRAGIWCFQRLQMQHAVMQMNKIHQNTRREGRCLTVTTNTLYPSD